MNKIILLSICLLSILPCVAQNKTVELGNNFTLERKNDPVAHRYRVSIELRNGVLANSDMIRSIEYEVSVSELFTLNHNMRTIQIDRFGDVFVDDIGSNLSAARNIAVRTSAAMYPMTLVVNDKGEISDVINHAEIMERWEETKTDLRKDFDGEGLEKYLYWNDKAFNEKRVLIRSLRNERFLHAYLDDIYCAYTDNYNVVKIKNVPYIFDCNGVEFTVEQQLSKKTDENDKIRIEAWGKYTDKRSVTDLKHSYDFLYHEGSPKPKGNYSSLYMLDPQYNTIHSFLVSSAIKYDDRTDGTGEGRSLSILVAPVPEGENKKWPSIVKIAAREGKLFIPIHTFKKEDVEVHGLLNPLMDIRDITRPERNYEGIKIG